MQYLLYLRKSFKMQAKLHLTLFIVLICAFILLLLIPIYRDSSAYDTRQRLLDWTKGETFHILNAAETDAALFEDIEGLSAPLAAMAQKYQRPIINSGATYLIVRGYDYYSAHGIPTDSTSSQQLAQNWLKFQMDVFRKHRFIPKEQSVRHRIYFDR